MSRILLAAQILLAAAACVPVPIVAHRAGPSSDALVVVDRDTGEVIRDFLTFEIRNTAVGTILGEVGTGTASIELRRPRVLRSGAPERQEADSIPVAIGWYPYGLSGVLVRQGRYILFIPEHVRRHDDGLRDYRGVVLPNRRNWRGLTVVRRQRSVAELQAIKALLQDGRVVSADEFRDSLGFGLSEDRARVRLTNAEQQLVNGYLDAAIARAGDCAVEAIKPRRVTRRCPTLH